LREYTKYHQEDRLHGSLDKDTPNQRKVEPRPGVNTEVTSLARLRGLNHRYKWRQAA